MKDTRRGSILYMGSYMSSETKSETKSPLGWILSDAVKERRDFKGK